MSLFAVTPNVGRDYVFGLCFDIGPRVISSLAIISAGCFNLINVVSLRSRSRMYMYVFVCVQNVLPYGIIGCYASCGV